MANQRFNQMITTRVLGTVLLDGNGQVNCNDCISGFGSAGSFSAGIHGRKNLTDNLALLAGIAYAQYGHRGYEVSGAPIAAFALRYDFVNWGSSRPFFDAGAILSPFENVRYRRDYTTSLGPVSISNRTDSDNYGVFGRAGWVYRPSTRDELAASVEVWQLWQRVRGYQDSSTAVNPFDATIGSGTDRTHLFKIGAQWTRLLIDNLEVNLNGGFVQSFSNRSGLVANVTGVGQILPSIGNPNWFEYGGRVGYRLRAGMTLDMFANGTLGTAPVGNTIHGGLGLRMNY